MDPRQLQDRIATSSYREALYPCTLDDGAFVDSLFASEMRSAVGSSTLFLSLPSCGRVKGPPVPTPPGSINAVPAPPNSLLGGGIVALSSYQVPFQPPTDDTPLFVRLNEDDMFGQMLHEQDFHDFHGFKKETQSGAPKPSMSNNALLLEPLELPPKDGSGPVPHFRATSSSGMPSASTSSSYGLESTMMPGYPTSGPPYYGNYSNPTVAASHAWAQEAQEAQEAIPLDPLLLAHQPSPGSVDMFPLGANTPQATPGVWLAMLKPSEPTPLLAPHAKSRTPRHRPSFSCTISPPSSVTSQAYKELIVSADAETPLLASPLKHHRVPSGTQQKATVASSVAMLLPLKDKKFSHVQTKISKGKKCVEPTCLRRAQSNSRCKAHGGGARCQYTGEEGCSRSSQGGGFCRAHGGGKRCEFPGCPRGQQRKGRCYVHGGIRKCTVAQCEKKDRGTGFCIAHGGGKRCQMAGCSRAVRRGVWCQVHEGGDLRLML